MLNYPRYRLASDTVRWSLELSSGETCIRGVRFNNVVVDRLMVVSAPQTGHVTLQGTGFSYKAAKDFQGRDFFSLVVSGAANNVPGNSIIEVEVSVSSASELRSFSTTIPPSRQTSPPSLASPGKSSPPPPPPLAAQAQPPPSQWNPSNAGPNITVPQHNIAEYGSTFSRTFMALHTYYMSPSGSDSNNGTSPTSCGANCGPWLTPKHSVNCGDVIVAAAGSYSAIISGSWGTVSNCPSASGGIDGTGGIYFAVLLCGGTSVGACSISRPSCTSTGAGLEIDKNNWAVEGWSISWKYTSSCSGYGFAVDTSTNTGVKHHIAFINNIASNNAFGYGSSDSHGANGGSGYGIDYYATIGDISQNSAGREDGYYTGSNVVIGTSNFDTSVGTHIIVEGNFAFNNLQPGCVSPCVDGENYLFDTLDALNYTQKIVFRNNYGVLSERFGLQMIYGANNVNLLSLYIYNNTFYDNVTNPNDSTGGGCCSTFGDINLQGSGGNMPWNVYIYNNIAQVTVPGGVAIWPYAFVCGGAYNACLNVGNTGSNPSNSQNIFKSVQISCHMTNCDPGFNVAANGGSSTYFGVNTYTDPLFTNTTDLLANQMGAPNCTGFINTAACMGYNAKSRVMTTPSFISDLVPAAAAAAGKGAQLPSTTCSTTDTDYPTWLKGIVYLHWNGTSVTQNFDLVTLPCGL